MDEKEYEVTIREVLEKKVRYRGRNELEATAKQKQITMQKKSCWGQMIFPIVIFLQKNWYL